MNSAKVGARLQRLRTDRKLTQAEFAATLGVSAPAYKNYERGVRDITSHLLNQLYRTYDIDPLWLIAADDSDPTLTPLRPSLNLSLLKTVGIAVETAIVDQGAYVPLKSKYDIIALLYRQALQSGRLDRDAMQTMISIGANAPLLSPN